jgi:uncharacterized protein (TIGR02145 family)
MMTREVSLLTIAGWMSIRIEPGSLIVYDNKLTGAEIEFTAIIGSKEISYTTGFTPVSLIPVIPPDATSCEIIIGSQIWMCKNFDSNYPGSKVYNNNELFRPLYGGLYTYNQIMSPGFCPAGWRIPILNEWLTMLTYIGGALTAGGKLKEIGITNWDAPNFGAVDTYGFTQRPTGYFYGIFGEGGRNANLWTATPYDLTKSYFMQMGYDNAQVGHADIDNNYYLGVRLIKDVSYSVPVVVIGTQTWMLYNISDNIVGSKVYNNDEANRAEYGGLYSLSMIAAIEALYPGFHVPTNAEWLTLINYLGGIPVAGKHLKEAGNTHWAVDLSIGDNSSGFTARGGGLYWPSAFHFLMSDSFYLTSTDFGGGNYYVYGPDSTTDSVWENHNDNTYFQSVRLIKNP